MPRRLITRRRSRLFDQKTMQADGTLVFAAEPSFQKLMGRIGDIAESRALLGAPMPAARAPGVPSPRRAKAGITQWLAAAMLLEAVGLGYGAWAWHAHTVATGPYVTLTSARHRPTASGRVRASGSCSAPDCRCRAARGLLLRQAGAHIIDGPTAANVYTLGFADGGITPDLVERRAAELRANADVLFAEPQT